MPNHLAKILLFFPLASVILGCGSDSQRPDGLPPLLPMTITVVQAGVPLTDAVVTLTPDSGPTRWGSGGYSNAQGKVAVKTHGNFPGAPAGKYKVTVLKREREGEGEGNVTEYYLVDPVYESAETTPFRVDVGSGSKEAKFDVGESIRLKIE